MIKRIMTTVGLLLLSGCGTNLNEFEFAEPNEQLKVLMIDECTSMYLDDYCKVLKNGDIAYFDETYNDAAIVNPTAGKDHVVEFINMVYNDDVKDNKMIDKAKEVVNEIKRQMRKNGMGGNVIYVIQDHFGDLVFRMDNTEITYDYFETKEAKEIINNK